MRRRINAILITNTIAVLLCTCWLTASATEGAFKLPPYEKYALKNGLTVYLMEQHEVPLIYVSMVFPAGAVKDGDKYGLASLTADGLLFGTKIYSKQQIEETLDFIGAGYGTSAAKEFSEISMSFVATDQEQVFPIFKEIVMNPIFDEQEFDKRKKRLLTNLERAKEQPHNVIGSYYAKFMFDTHVYGNPVSGIIGSVTEITVDDLKEFYRSNYQPGKSAIAIVGSFQAKDMKGKIKKLFQDWKSTAALSSIDMPQIPSYSNSRILLVNKDDATETQFIIGSFGIKRSNPDYVSIQVINTILGDRFTSWLNDELRINRGLTYGVRSSFAPYKDSGLFYISSFTPTETTVEALDVSIEVLSRLHNKGVDEETLRSAKNYIKGQYPPESETSGSLADLLTAMFIYDFDDSFINDFQKNVDDMTTETAQRIIKSYFPKEKLQFVLIGKAVDIRDAVAKYGTIEEKEIKTDGF